MNCKSLMLESLLDEILRQHSSEETKLHGRWGGRRDVNNAEEVTPCGAHSGLSTRPGRVEVSCWMEETRREGTLWEEELSRKEEGKEKQLGAGFHTLTALGIWWKSFYVVLRPHEHMASSDTRQIGEQSDILGGHILQRCYSCVGRGRDKMQKHH